MQCGPIWPQEADTFERRTGGLEAMDVRALIDSARRQMQALGVAGDDVSQHSDDVEHAREVSLRFENMDLTHVPPELLDVLAESPAIIDKLSFKSNHLTNLPPLLSLDHLYYVDVSHNDFTEFPPALYALPSLEILDLSYNKISVLSQSITRLSGLKVLSITHNLIEYIPPVLADLPGLVFLEVEGNPLVLPSYELLSQVNQDDWLSFLRNYIKENRPLLESRTSGAATSPPRVVDMPKSAERFRSASESVLSSRAAKRMGFVMRKNSTELGSASDHTASNSLYQIPNMEPYPDRHVPTPTTPVTHASPQLSSSGSGTDTRTMPPASDVQYDASYSPREAPHTPDLRHSEDLSYIATPENLGPRKRSTGSSPSQGGSYDSRSAPQSGAPREDDSPLQKLMSSPFVGTGHLDLKRLSTLEEEEDSHQNGMPKQEFTRPIRNIVFTLYEFLSVVRRCLALCQDTSTIDALSTKITSTKTMLSSLVEFIDKGNESDQSMRQLCLKCVSSTGELVSTLLSPKVLDSLCQEVEIYVLRSLILQTFQSFNELQNSWTLLSSYGRSPVTNIAEDFAAADDQLYQQLESATKSAQSVLSLLNDTIQRSALETAENGNKLPSQSTDPSKTTTGVPAPQSNSNPVLAARVRDLSNACISGFTSIRKLRSSLDRRGERGIIDRRRFWDDVNSFIKSTISILAAAKSAMADLPLLTNVSPQISTLARVTKEIPPLLEQSSYKTATQDELQRQPTQIGSAAPLSVGGEVNSPSLAAPTPLTASLGAAAQVVVSPGQTPAMFIQEPFERHSSE